MAVLEGFEPPPKASEDASLSGNCGRLEPVVNQDKLNVIANQIPGPLLSG